MWQQQREMGCVLAPTVHSAQPLALCRSLEQGGQRWQVPDGRYCEQELLPWRMKQQRARRQRPLVLASEPEMSFSEQNRYGRPGLQAGFAAVLVAALALAFALAPAWAG